MLSYHYWHRRTSDKKLSRKLYTALTLACQLLFLWSIISHVLFTLKLAKNHMYHFKTHIQHTTYSFSVQASQRKTFFSVFYLCINGGSLLSTIITPILRGRYEQDIKFMTNRAIKLWQSLKTSEILSLLFWHPTFVSICSSWMWHPQ